ncbi:relaxase/mobilization nuclease domain-containing protein [Sphingobacterium sp. BN32]|uniref:relaxase/mobilization nuclease domain-containing protein n=1 Tax=Sphingobacterium sp. BN32 TaxID=3058432 RepID=UPI00265CF11F|nr:relaxase/mobilization nuclease domain-containing protein [Sphingobacterium sp. BN32]WKK60363.1 relaxase/mobilization nuclease domain-containing protein [Sphingobacterium sp. BN32]
MIAKIIEGRSFGGCVGYVLKEDSEIIHANGLRTDSTTTIAQDFNFQRMLKPRLGKAVGHIILSWNTADKNMLDNDIMVSSAKRYLAKMGIRDTQCLMVRHHDREHDHIHIIYNRVDNHGKTISNSNQRYKSFTACKELNALYGFKQSDGKQNVNRGRLKGNDRTRYQIYDTLKAGIRISRNWTELQNYIRYRGVEMQFKYRSRSDEVQGISFSKNGQTFRGSAIDRSLSYGQIDRALNGIDNAMGQTHRIESNVSTDRSMDSNIGETIGYLASALFSIPESTSAKNEPLNKKRKKKKNYGLKR